MAYASVTSLRRTLGLVLQSSPYLNLPQDQERIKSVHKKVEERVQSLREKLHLLQECLENLEKNIDDRKAVERCEGKIKVAAHDAEYRIESVLENFYKAENEKVRIEAYEELCKRLQQASKLIDSEGRELSTESIKSSGVQAMSSLVQSFDLPEHSPQLDNSNMVGHVNEVEDMKSKVMDISSNEREIVAITGMGGIGKTTFARRIYEDPEIKSHFDILAWATMSKEYCIRQMLLQLLHCIPSTEDVRLEEMDDGDLAGKLKQRPWKCRFLHCIRSTEDVSLQEMDATKKVSLEEMDDGDLAGKLKQRLWKRRYLIVIDDIWTTKAWDDISQWFPDCKGSHILLTTRCTNVASYAAPDKPPRHMYSLNAEESWELLQSKLLDKVQLSPKLSRVGMKIANNCHGVPLTITVVAGLLSKCDDALDRWEQVAKDVKSAIFKDPDRQCEKVLALSYCYLPQRLKACFLYFGIFPEDYEVNVKRLINLWVAEGFLKENERKSLEDIAEECLHELIERNLVLVTRRHNFCGKVKACKVHDLLHELCLIQAQSENFLPVINNNKSQNHQVSRFSRSSIQAKIVQLISGNSHHYDQKEIRTVVYQGILPVIFDTQSMLNFKNFRMIRVLEAMRDLRLHDGVDQTSLFDLAHLRYLSLTIESHKLLHLFKFQNLQFLIVEIECPNHSIRPMEIWTMPRLRYICFMKTRLTCPPNMNTDEGNHPALKHLHTITGVGPSWCEKYIFAKMPNVRKLVIVLGNHYELFDFVTGALCWPSRIEALSISILDAASYQHSCLEDYYSAFSHLRGRILPSSLKRVTLCRLRLSWTIMGEIFGTLPNLETLKLTDRACEGDRWEPANGSFSRLRILLLDDIDFTKWNATEDNFPVLERLFISHCLRLKEIPQEFANIMTLQVIELNGCSVQLSTTAEQIQQEQEAIFGGETTTIRVYNIRKG